MARSALYVVTRMGLSEKSRESADEIFSAYDTGLRQIIECLKVII